MILNPQHKGLMYKLLFSFVLIAGLSYTPIVNGQSGDKKEELLKLYQLMTGEFSSEEQAKADTSFYSINLVMYPIWEGDKDVKWLYVEQAVTEYMDKPYRQRVYRVSMTEENMFESRVYTLNNPSKYIHAWDTPELFNQINPDSISLREGCAVFLKKEGDCFTGSTNEKDCESTLRGASYATSIVTVCKDQVVSWDQGWDANDQQVWGAEKEGYVFKRKK